jgi:hypothetical protein
VTPSWLRLAGAAVAVVGALALLIRRRGLLGRAEALALLALLVLLAIAVAPGVADVLPALTGFTGELARITSLLAFAVLALTAIVLAVAGRLVDLRREFEDHLADALVDRAWPERPAPMTSPVDLVLVMPAFDEADNLRAILPARPRELGGLVAHLVVVDDGSRDGTSDVAAEHGAWPIRSPMNRGGGFALKVGFAAARRLRARYVLTLDADGQHRWDDLPTVLAPLQDGRAELVVGSRRLGASVGAAPVRALGVRVFSAFLSFLTQQPITDCASGLRGVHLKMIGELRLHQTRHHTAELIIEAARRRLRIGEVPITIVPRHTGLSKKGGTVGYALRFFATIMTTWWRR